MEKKYKLPKEFAEKWLAALRSGEHEQGKGALCRNGKMCCLGVADIIVAGNEPSDRDSIKYDRVNVPAEIRGGNEFTAALATMNDEGNKTFLQIADFIEQNCSLY